MLTLVTVKHLPATDTKGTRYSVTNGRTGQRVTVPFNYSAYNPHTAAAQSALAGWGVTVEKIEHNGSEDGLHLYMAYSA